MIKPEEIVENAKLVTEWFGYWPTFHDDTITEISMTASGPTLSMKIYSDGPLDGSDNKIKKRCSVTLTFLGLRTVELEGFDKYNIIFNLKIGKVSNYVKVSVNATCGVSAEIVCDKAMVESVLAIV